MKPHPRRFAPIKLARVGAVSVGVLLLTTATHGQVPCGGYEVTAIIQTPVEGPLGDLNADCQVGAPDLLILLSSWGPCDNCKTCPADLNGDCVVGASDLLILLVNWG